MIDDRLYGELLKPVAEAFYSTCKSLAATEATSATEASRAFLHGRLHALQETGDQIAAVLGVPEPLWADMRDLTRSVAA